jgi:hypothetical protein
VTCCASCPEVVCSTHAYDSGLWHFDLVSPQRIGLVIFLIHTHPDTLRRQLKDLQTKTCMSACGSKAIQTGLNDVFTQEGLPEATLFLLEPSEHTFHECMTVNVQNTTQGAPVLHMVSFTMGSTTHQLSEQVMACLCEIE